MLINFDDQINKLQDVRTGKVKEGLTLGFNEIDSHFRFKYGNFTIWLGHANSGKTTMTLFFMLLYSIKHKLNWLVYSSENEPYSIIKKLIEFLAVKPINKITDDEFKKHKDFVFEHFKFIDANDLYTYKSLIELGTVVKNAWNYQGFLIDPYNSLLKDRDTLKGISGHDYDYQATSEFRVFCRKHNVSIWLCTHAATEALRKKFPKGHRYENQPIPPMASDVEGGGKFVNRCDDMVCCHRMIYDSQDWMYTQIHIRKIKDIDSGGRPTSIDNPILLKSIINNVGFKIGTDEAINKTVIEQLNLPF
jgi:hypothetical protein